ncbi:nicotinate mononucleotide-dependent phosphoribosyltransferase CobT [Leptolyngbya sp. FACHB-261]|uniref:nicotinate mononucleotide-dependent phosphoribosyltransferase CobT n=1 Tax=Leptolyngbya sp. FACHB-261 TaxID=2692806 RepID=UPI001688E506|nr:TIGR00303 family protein [Leptolyngbya sp. FACHB-261]MBD2101255.1 TIGR00303 family protein [Leptolyngbya sp. FACHB-261]
MIRTYAQVERAETWLARYRGQQPTFVCVLGFTATGLIPGISAAGATPEARRFTAVADAEFLVDGPSAQPRYPLPPLDAGASPVLISRAVVTGQAIPVLLFNAGLPVSPAVASIELDGRPAQCLSTGQALPLEQVQALFEQGLHWGNQLADRGYLIIGECVVGGTTTALAVLTGLGIEARNRVNSSHPTCNHEQKWSLVQQGLAQLRASDPSALEALDPLALVAAVGDPMQVVVAGMTLSASRHTGVLLAGGTQMLAVYALARALAQQQSLAWQPEQVVIGTTRWVAEDPTGDTIGLAKAVNDVPLLATCLSFANSQYPQLRAYEQGFVKEGVGAGGLAIASSLYQGWDQHYLQDTIEELLKTCRKIEVE